MINSESINLIESAISDCETEIEKLDQLKATAGASQETINKLESDLADLGINKAGLEQRARASRLTSGTALLTLERGDLAAFNSQIDNQTDRIIQFGGRATGLLQELWSDVLAWRKAHVEDMIRRTFDVDRIRVLPMEMLVTSAHCVIEIEQLDSVLFQYRAANEKDLSLNDARLLGERSACLIQWARDLQDFAPEQGPPAAARQPVVA